MIIRKESFFNGLILSYTCHYQSYYFSSWLKTFTLYLVCTYCVTISSLSLKDPHSTQCVLSNSTLGHYPFHFTTPPLNLQPSHAFPKAVRDRNGRTPAHAQHTRTKHLRNTNLHSIPHYKLTQTLYFSSNKVEFRLIFTHWFTCKKNVE